MTESNRVEVKPVSPPKEIGRNEPCPCRSGKKYKRCCGVGAAPKLTEPKNPSPGPGFDPSLIEGMDPNVLMQMTQAFQKLPKGQLQRMQALMQKAMSGKDITTEAQEFERSLPPDFQELMQSWGQAALQSAPDATAPSENIPELGQASSEATTVEEPAMTEEQARELIAKAAAEGTISKEQAESLLNPVPVEPTKAEAGPEP